MSKYLESCNNECKIVMLLLVAVLAFLLYQCYNKPSACVKEGFATTLAQRNQIDSNVKNYKTPAQKQARKTAIEGQLKNQNIMLASYTKQKNTRFMQITQDSIDLLNYEYGKL